MAVLKVLSDLLEALDRGDVLCDLLEALDRGDVAVLLLLHLSAAFDTVDYETLLQRLELAFGVSGTALNWLASYLSGRDYSVRLGANSSEVLQMRTAWCTCHKGRSGSAILHYVGLHCGFN